MNKTYQLNAIVFFGLLVMHASCKKLVIVDGPPTSSNSDVVYSNDADATAVLSNLYIRMSQSEIHSSGNLMSIPFYAGLSADELVLSPNDAANNLAYRAHYENNLDNSIEGLPNYWTDTYNMIYVTNAAIEGVTASKGLTPAVRKQLLGEARFMRAFCYFYLINLYGDVPLNLTTDYQVNSRHSRTDKTTVYDQIIADLKVAQEMLTEDYKNALLLSTDERVKPNKYAATALLARAFLYKGDFVNAELEASKVIDHSSVYSLVPADKIFLKNSMETIWALQPVRALGVTNTSDAIVFFPQTGSSSLSVYLSADLMTKFHPGDIRKTAWIDSVSLAGTTVYCSRKYRNNEVSSAVTEYPIVIRLAEQYLIRAEARAMQGKLVGMSSAESDLNAIRNRAGLQDITAAGSKDAMLAAVLDERRIELMLEWGHRWLDLKRTDKADEVLGNIKSPNWQTTDQLYLIPQAEINQNPAIHQNPQ